MEKKNEVIEKTKEIVLNEMDGLKEELNDLNERRNFVEIEQTLALLENNVEKFKIFSDEFIELGKRIVFVCSRLNDLSNEYSKLVIEGYNK